MTTSFPLPIQRSEGPSGWPPLPDALAHEHARLISRARLLSVVAALAYPAFWFAERAAGVAVLEDFWVRLTTAVLLAAVGAATYLSAFVRRHAAQVVAALIWVVTGHSYLLAAINGLHTVYTTGSILVLLGFLAGASLAITSSRGLASYLTFVAVAASAAALVSDAPPAASLHFLLTTFTALVLVYLSVSGQLAMVGRLRKAEFELRDDIERRTRAESELRRSKRQTGALLEAVPDVMLVIDADAKVVDVLGAHQGDLGPHLAQLRGYSCDLLMLEGEGEGLGPHVDKALCGGGLQVVSGQTLYGGETHHVEVRLTPMDSRHVLALVRDCTAEKSLEAQVRVADRLAALGTLAGGVSHEINNPLTYVLSNIEFAIEELEQGGGEAFGATAELLEALHDAKDGGQRIARIVKDLRSHAQSRGEGREPIDAADAVQAALRIMEGQLRDRASVEVSIGQVPRVLADSARLVQVLVNLLANAGQALPEGEADAHRIRVGLEVVPSGKVQISVADDGPGISPAHRQRIFDPFFTTKDEQQGTGLGLYLCHKFVTGFGGTLTLDETPGGGATFRITLKPAGSAHVSLSPSARTRLLIVDDEPLVGRSLARILGSYEVTVVDSVAAAKSACTAADFDVILCDLSMPDGGGAAFFGALNEIKPHLCARVVFMSGGAAKGNAARLLSRLSNPCLDKPVTRRELERVARITAAPQ
ncbi:MAG: ATP-binding protein [Myxococcales bacterium]|nr:ATP-binding protein [Myxococcales bacterium]